MRTIEPMIDKTSDKNSWPIGLHEKLQKQMVSVAQAKTSNLQDDDQDSTISDLEIRIAFLEDQIDALNREVVLLNRDRDQLTEELHALANGQTGRTFVTTRCQR